ncbi:MAG: hypothetical protein M3Z66_00590, partial [Chloroflexota bacterium]|nr:hypothetical protein [Chloroflexota bacterium]
MMQTVRRILCLLIVVGLVPVPTAFSAPYRHTQYQGLSAVERAQGAVAARLVSRQPSAVAHWLRHQNDVSTVAVGPDHATIAISFRDGAELAILPRARPAFLPLIRPASSAGSIVRDPGTAGRAIVLEPFATELGLGPTAGQDEVNALTRAGFTVDVLRDAQVTVGTMGTLSSYGAVYFQTHAGVLPDGDAVVVTGQTDSAPYGDLYRDHSLIQAFVAGDPAKKLYNAITSHFVAGHMSAFPSGSIMFLNGCAVLSAPVFWQALQQQNVSALISWNGDVYSSSNEVAGSYVTTKLVNGDSVSTAVDDARQAGVGFDVVGDTVVHLGFSGDGAATLSAVLGRKAT